MDKTQEEKICEWCKNGKPGLSGYERAYTSIATIKAIWNACLSANGIEEKQDDKPYRVYVFKNANEMKQFAKDRIEPDLANNPFYNTELGEPFQESSLIDLVREISESVKDIAKKLKPEIVNVEAKGINLQKLLDDLKARIDEERAKATFGTSPEAKEWTPKEGDAVFFRSNDEYITVAVYDKEEGDYHFIKNLNGDRIPVLMKHLKPFNLSSIGKPWSEI